MRKDEILDRLVSSDGLLDAYSRPEREKGSPSCDHWSGPVLLERVAYLRKLAHFSDGTAGDAVREYPGYRVELMVLVRNGDAAIREMHALTFLVLDGRATLVCGGEVERPRKAADGEVRGAAINGGQNREVRRGDVVHVAAGVPYQFVLSGEKGISALVIRVDS